MRADHDARADTCGELWAVFGRKWALCVHFTTLNCSHPLRRNCSGLIQEALLELHFVFFVALIQLILVGRGQRSIRTMPLKAHMSAA